MKNETNEPLRILYSNSTRDEWRTQAPPSGWYGFSYGQDFGVVLGPVRLSAGLTGDYYFVKKGLSVDDKISTELGIYKFASERFESYQEGLPVVSHSGFGVDDLVSNLIGFYRALDQNLDIKNVEKLCGAILSKEQTLAVWDQIGGAPKNRTWKPILFGDRSETVRKCCKDEPQEFPEEFQEYEEIDGTWKYYEGDFGPRGF